MHRRRTARTRTPRQPRAAHLPARSIPTRLFGVVEHVGAQAHVRFMHKELARLTGHLATNEPLPHGEIVEVELGPPHGHYGGPEVKIIARHGPHAHALAAHIAVANAEIPHIFSPAALAEAAALTPYTFNPADGRTDWRHLPFITIDGEDAKDYDDAVQAEPLGGGNLLVRVAIADVAHYVAPGSALDAAARARGNSTYFPGHVVPMLPEELSNHLCSLKPLADRPVLGVELTIDSAGVLLQHRFCRAVIHSAARCTYTQVQAALDGQTNAVPPTLLPHIKHLEAAYRALETHKNRRGALDLNIPEIQIILGEDGHIHTLAPRPRHTAHKLIEEIMILANVAAAHVLGRTKHTGLYRVHLEPTQQKLAVLRATLAPLGLRVPQAVASPKAWAPLVEKLHAHPAAAQLLKAILQTQMQAHYTPHNSGHYGLALPLYSHFTSPIRRYADLITHRALLAAIKAGPTAHVLPTPEITAIAEHLNFTERRSQTAEWEARDRLIALHFEALTGSVLPATVLNCQPYGVFVSLGGVAEALLPARLLEPAWHFARRTQTWRHGPSTKQLAPGSAVQVKLIEADWVQARLTAMPYVDKTAATKSRPELDTRRPKRR